MCPSTIFRHSISDLCIIGHREISLLANTAGRFPISTPPLEITVTQSGRSLSCIVNKYSRECSSDARERINRSGVSTTELQHSSESPPFPSQY